MRDSLATPAIEKDVLLTSTIYKPALMKQLFELGCSYSAEILSLTKLLGQLQDAGNVTTLSSYLTILDQCNLLTAYRGTTYEKDRINPDVWGRWVESAVGAYLLGGAEEGDYRVFYWREKADEVDFIIQR